jgi:hypothetical protein
MKKIILSLIFLLSGCATTANYENILNSWVGLPETSLIEKWGIPNSVYEAGGVKYLSYSKSQSGYVPGVAPSYQTTVIGNTAYTNAVGGTPGFAFTNTCNTTFMIRNNTIFNWRWEGNACRAR